MARRRFQFRLRTLMIVVAAFCVVFGWYISQQKKIIAERQALMKEITSTFGGQIAQAYESPPLPDPSVPLIRDVLGDEAVKYIFLPVSVSTGNLRKVRVAFPEAKILARTREGDVATFPQETNSD